MINTKAKIHNAKKIGRATFAVVLCVFVLFLVFLFVFNANYSEAYGTPRVENGVLDMTGRSTYEPDRNIAINLGGEWEFFYNRWIVTDGENDARPDGKISVPGRWTGKKFGSDKMLPAEGYASYRLKITNLAPGNTLWILRVNFAGAYRIFIDGELATQCGTVSKDPSETESGSPQRKKSVISTGEDITVVLELSACRNGGLNAAPWLSAEGGQNLEKWGVIADIRFAMLGAVLAVFVFIIFIVIGFYKYEKSIDMAALAGLLAVHFIFSKDIANALDIGYDAASVVGLITAYAVVFTFGAVLRRMGAGMSDRANAVWLAVQAALAVLYCFLRTTDLAFIPLCGAAVCSFVMLYPLCVGKKVSAAAKYALLLMYLLTASSFILEAADGTGAIVFGTESIFSFILLIIIFLAAFIIALRALDMTRQAIRSGNLERELFELKQDTLQAQIKPHFVFNSLTAIQALYRKSVEEGEAQLLHFAQYLRTNIDAKGSSLIPFEEEVEHILNYFELENLRRGGTLTLLLDIKEKDFDVPLLSLQPFVENAVRHAKTEEREDGYIMLSSAREDDGVVIRVADNGAGFDTQTVSPRVGAANARVRFEELLGARVEVRSRVGEGTEIAVHIPKIGQSKE